MVGISQLIKQISQVDSGWKIAAFAICGILTLAQLLVNKKGRILPVPVLMTIIIVIFLAGALPIVANLIIKLNPGQPIKISVIVTTDSGFRCTDSKVNVYANNADTRLEYSDAASAWEYFIDANDLGKEKSIVINAETKDQKCKAQQKINLGDDLVATVTLTLSCAPVPKTFSINITDSSLLAVIRQKTGYEFDPASSNKILFTYDPGSLVHQQSSDVYFLARSHPVMYVNRAPVPLNNCYIPESLPSHVRERIEQYGRTQSLLAAKGSLRQNPDILVTWIKKLDH